MFYENIIIVLLFTASEIHNAMIISKEPVLETMGSAREQINQSKEDCQTCTWHWNDPGYPSGLKSFFVFAEASWY